MYKVLDVRNSTIGAYRFFSSRRSHTEKNFTKILSYVIYLSNSEDKLQPRKQLELKEKQHNSKFIFVKRIEVWKY